MFDILRPPSYNKWILRHTNVDSNFRRKRTDIISVESLNYCKTVRISSTQTPRNMPSKGGNGNGTNQDVNNNNAKKKDARNINVNVKVLRDECDCSLKKKKKPKQGDELKDLECYCSEGLPQALQNDGARSSAVQEEHFGRKNVKTIEATAKAAPKGHFMPRKEAAFEKMITYQVQGRSIGDPAGFDWTKTYWVSQ